METFEKKYIEIPDGYEARIEGNKVVFSQKESEDEKIRKEMIFYFQEEIHLCSIQEHADKMKEFVAYLEKQKEQNPICNLNNLKSSSISFPFKAKIKSSGAIVRIYGGQLNQDGKEWIKYQSDAEDGYKVYEPDNLELVCELEQQPAELDNKEMGMSDFESELFSAFSDAWQQYLHGEEVDAVQWTKEHSAQLLNAAKQELKPAEWNEEDEGMLNCIIVTLCEESHGGRETNNKMVTWLENRLKFLRPQPHWRPTKRQIDALNSIILTGSFTYVGQTQDLIALKDELKKLM